MQMTTFQKSQADRFSKSQNTDEHLYGYHPSKCLPKKRTTFNVGSIAVRFDRINLPRSGKSIVGDCFIETKKGITSLWCLRTRALIMAATDYDMVINQMSTLKFKKIMEELNE